MSTAIQLHSETMGDWAVIRQQAEVLVKTGFLPQSIKTPEQAMAIILTGRELGIGAMAALNTINVIQGKPTISPQLMLALINRTGELEEFSVADDGQACTVTMKRRGRKPHAETFSMKDAALMKTTEGYGENKKTISLSEKYNWRQMPAIMRKWRAVAACARIVFPDVILGMYTPEEMGAATDVETGEIVEAVAEPADIELREEVQEVIQDALTVAAVRTVKLEGAQPTSGQRLPEGLEGAAGHVVKLANTLGWDEIRLSECIHAAFGTVVVPGKLGEYLQFATKDELRELYRIMNSKGKQ